MFEWIKNLFIKKEGPNVLELDNKLLQEKIDKLEDETVPELISLNNELKTEILTANNKLAEYVKEEYQETYWNDKRPKASGYTYPARPNILSGTNNVEVDPRIFWTPFAMPSVTGSNDEIAKKSLQHVIDKTKYTSDTSQFKDDETWLFAFETSNLKKGDCEDGAIYLANILLSNGVPYWRIRLNAGDVYDGNGKITQNLNMSTSFNKVWLKELKDFKKEIVNGITVTHILQGLKQVRELVYLPNLKKAVFLAIKEKESADNLFVNTLGRQLKIDQKFVKNVETLQIFEYITKIKTDKTINQKILKYYVILVIVDIMEKRKIVDNFLKDKNLGIKLTEGSAGHCWVTYLRELDNKWIILDWCYWSDESKDLNLLWDKAEKYFDIWFSFNTRYIYLDEDFERKKTSINKKIGGNTNGRNKKRVRRT